MTRPNTPYECQCSDGDDEVVTPHEALQAAVDRDDGLEVVVASGLNGVVYVHPDDEDGKLDIRWRW